VVSLTARTVRSPPTPNLLPHGDGEDAPAVPKGAKAAWLNFEILPPFKGCEDGDSLTEAYNRLRLLFEVALALAHHHVKTFIRIKLTLKNIKKITTTRTMSHISHSRSYSHSTLPSSSHNASIQEGDSAGGDLFERIDHTALVPSLERVAMDVCAEDSEPHIACPPSHDIWPELAKARTGGIRTWSKTTQRAVLAAIIVLVLVMSCCVAVCLHRRRAHRHANFTKLATEETEMIMEGSPAKDLDHEFEIDEEDLALISKYTSKTSQASLLEQRGRKQSDDSDDNENSDYSGS
jgi:hypothetical protein